jgi:hypothetical protein
MTEKEFKGIYKIESCSAEATNLLLAGARLTSSEYCTPVQG